MVSGLRGDGDNMQQAINNYIRSNPELRSFIRYNPIWYRYLTRDPHRIEEMIKEAKKFHGRTFSQRVEKVTNQVQMIHTLIQLTAAMKD